jgi:hypothetical protein
MSIFANFATRLRIIGPAVCNHVRKSPLIQINHGTMPSIQFKPNHLPSYPVDLGGQWNMHQLSRLMFDASPHSFAA